MLKVTKVFKHFSLEYKSSTIMYPYEFASSFKIINYLIYFNGCEIGVYHYYKIGEGYCSNAEVYLSKLDKNIESEIKAKYNELARFAPTNSVNEMLSYILGLIIDSNINNIKDDIMHYFSNNCDYYPNIYGPYKYRILKENKSEVSYFDTSLFKENVA